MKPLIIGEAPSKNEITERPLEGRVGKRLAACCGMNLGEFLDYFDRVNLLHVRQDTAEKGFEFDLRAAKVSAQVLVEQEFRKGRKVILLGGRVAEAFGIHDHYFTWCQINEADVTIFPHPSGVNRWFNDPRNKAQAEVFMLSIVSKGV